MSVRYAHRQCINPSVSLCVACGQHAADMCLWVQGGLYSASGAMRGHDASKAGAMIVGEHGSNLVSNPVTQQQEVVRSQEQLVKLRQRAAVGPGLSRKLGTCRSAEALRYVTMRGAGVFAVTVHYLWLWRHGMWCKRVHMSAIDEASVLKRRMHTCRYLQLAPQVSYQT